LTKFLKFGPPLMENASNDTGFRETQVSPKTLRAELIVFAIIVAVIWPVVTVGIVGGYGFAVWMYQVVAGPPGPPDHS
jgi:nitrate reductase NapE